MRKRLDISSWEFEELIARYYEEYCAEHYGGMNYAVYRHKKYLGKSGQQHDIDVSIEIKNFDVRMILLIECKWWRQRVGVQEVMVLSERLEDIGAHKGIIVTKTGFEKGAYKFAQKNGIALQLCAGDGKVETTLESATPEAGIAAAGACIAVGLVKDPGKTIWTLVGILLLLLVVNGLIENLTSLIQWLFK